MTTAHDGRAVANFILDHCDERGRKVTNLALQKITYFCHVWSLIALGGPLIRHKFEAWEFGPVLPYLYRAFRNYERAPIVGRATFIDPADGRRRVADYEFGFETESLLRETVEFYSRLRASDLVELSHVEGGPWHSAWNHKGTVNPGMMIDDTHILKFYSTAPAPFAIQ